MGGWGGGRDFLWGIFFFFNFFFPPTLEKFGGAGLLPWGPWGFNWVGGTRGPPPPPKRYLKRGEKGGLIFFQGNFIFETQSFGGGLNFFQSFRGSPKNFKNRFWETPQKKKFFSKPQE